MRRSYLRHWLQESFRSLEQRRAVRIARRLHKYLKPGETVLDLGCGSLVVAAEVQRRAEVRIIGLETGNYRKRPLPMIIGAGQSAPFRDRSFDTVMIGFVLHHCPDGGIAVLREAGRLARKKILLLEDRYDHLLEQVVARLADKFLNRLENPNVPIPYRFRSSEEWKELFRELNLELLAMEMVRTTPVLETRQVLFVLRPSPDDSRAGTPLPERASRSGRGQ